MSKDSVKSGYAAKLLARLTQLKEKALARTGRVFPIIFADDLIPAPSVSVIRVLPSCSGREPSFQALDYYGV
jgi:hypothetical protein